MADYVAFLRAINLGKNRKFPMAEVRASLDAAGFADVETYIQSGNLRLSTSMRSPERVAARLEEVFAADRGFDVPTIVLTPSELRATYDEAMTLDVPSDGDVRRYVTLLKEPAGAAAVEAVHALEVEGESARVSGRAVHVWVRDGYRNAKLNNARLERILGAATTRDLKVIAALAQRWG